jgi:hypothetical protein
LLITGNSCIICRLMIDLTGIVLQTTSVKVQKANGCKGNKV